MSYVTKYSPRKLGEILGQGRAILAIQNNLHRSSIEFFQFVGPSGTGKSSAASIISKAVNCIEFENERDACCVCPKCLDFDTYPKEYYAYVNCANTSVEEIESALEFVNLPKSGHHKVLVFDEIGNLPIRQQGAFLRFYDDFIDAEKEAKFRNQVLGIENHFSTKRITVVFATTPDKRRGVDPSLRKRCINIEFDPISHATVIEHLREICQSEKIQATDDALWYLCNHGDGDMRSALNHLEYAVSLSGDREIDGRLLTEVFGIPTDTDYLQMITMIGNDTEGLDECACKWLLKSPPQKFAQNLTRTLLNLYRSYLTERQVSYGNLNSKNAYLDTRSRIPLKHVAHMAAVLKLTDFQAAVTSRVLKKSLILIILSQCAVTKKLR